MDRLDEMFELQRDLMMAVGPTEVQNGVDVPQPPYGHLEHRHVQMYIRMLTQFCIEELSEATHHLEAKPWKKNPHPVNVPAYEEELIDAFHFLMEILIVSGFNPADLYDTYRHKQEENVDRQARGY